MRITEKTKMFSGNVADSPGHKFVIAVNPYSLGWNAECVIAETKTGDVVGSFSRTFEAHMKVSGVVGQMKRKAKGQIV